MRIQIFKQDQSGDVVSDLEQSCFGSMVKLAGLGMATVFFILLVIQV